MSSKSNYNYFHKKSKQTKKIINDNNYTYRSLLFILKKYIKKLPLKSLILDVGCGTGNISLYLANIGFEVFGIDVSPKAVKLAQKSSKSLKLNNLTTFNISDVNKVSLEKEKYCLIICSEVIEHLKNDKKVLSMISNSLKKNGLLIISVPSKNAPLFRWGYADKFDAEVGHLRRYSESELISLVENQNLKVIETKKTEGLLRNSLFILNNLGWIVRFIKGPLVIIFSLLDNLFIRLFKESQIFVIAKK
ncbi:class I SAM-dependent methyltransferase [bacterium]|nr:class I SAM-dependent methyltransferase [bacterium]